MIHIMSIKSKPLNEFLIVLTQPSSHKQKGPPFGEKKDVRFSKKS